MSLTSENLVGYMRAEFAKSGRIRVWLFFVQLAAAVPAAVSVVIPDQDAVLLYALAILAIVLLIAWWVLNEFYVSANSAAQAARRAALLLGGLNQPLSPSEIQNLRERRRNARGGTKRQTITQRKSRTGPRASQK
jgi:hypothetical protein